MGYLLCCPNYQITSSIWSMAHALLHSMVTFGHIAPNQAWIYAVAGFISRNLIHVFWPRPCSRGLMGLFLSFPFFNWNISLFLFKFEFFRDLFQNFVTRSRSWNGGISFLFSYKKCIITKSSCFHFWRLILLQTWTISEIEALEKVDRKKTFDTCNGELDKLRRKQ